MIYLEYLALASITVFLSIKLSGYVDALDKKTNLSGALIGGVMLAAVTSLPELFTSLTAILSLDKPGLVQGNVLGSNIFNLTIFALLILLYGKKYHSLKIATSHRSTLIYSILMYLCVILALYLTNNINILGLNFNIFSVMIILIYGVSVFKMGNDNSGDSEEEDTSKLSVNQVVGRFIIFAVLLVIASIVLTNVSDKLSEELNLGATVGGAIFLGVATSLPELSASFSLVRMNNFNASVGNVIGSCCFNFIILGLADFLYKKGGIYNFDSQVLIFAMAGIIASLATFVTLKYQSNQRLAKLAGIIIFASYVLALTLSM